MFLLRRPTPDRIERFLARQGASRFSYPEVGASAKGAPDGYKRDAYGVRLGSGRRTFETAKEALGTWQMFNLGWVQLFPARGPLEAGLNVAVLVRVFPVWSLNAGRIAYVVDDEGPGARRSIGYGTLLDHAEQGEERFSVHWDQADDSVWYHVLAFSRPRMLLARLGYPMTRWLQRRFARASQRAMQRAVATAL